LSVHGSELKCKYLIKVNPGQVNKPGTQRQRKKYGGSSRDGAMGSAMARGTLGTGGGGREGVREESEISIVVLRGAFYCRFLLAE